MMLPGARAVRQPWRSCACSHASRARCRLQRRSQLLLDERLGVVALTRMLAEGFCERVALFRREKAGPEQILRTIVGSRNPHDRERLHLHWWKRAGPNHL